MMEWTDALRKYAEMKGKKFRIYKKGTPEYAEIKKLQASGGAKAAPAAPAVRKRKVEMTEEGGMKVTIPAKSRKPRSDIGKKRITTKQVVDESVRLKLVKPSEAYGRKTRSDKGQKRGPRKAKASHLFFDEEGNVM